MEQYEFLEAQMTLHNMELEAVYFEGYRGCLSHLTNVNAIKSE